jgi:hypothetical protein
MWISNIALISGVMVGLELKFLDEEAYYDFSLVIDLFIVRIVIQKLKHVR